MLKQKNSSYYLKQTFSEHHENILKEENIEKNGNLDCEDGKVSDVLTKIAKKFRETIRSGEASKKVKKVRKFLKLIDSFFHSIFDSKRNG